MKKTAIIVILFVCLAFAVQGQTELTLDYKDLKSGDDDLSSLIKPGNVIPDDVRDRLTSPNPGTLIIVVSGIPQGKTIAINSIDLNPEKNKLNITEEISSRISPTNQTNNKTYKVSLKGSDNTYSNFGKFEIKWNQPGSTGTPETVAQQQSLINKNKIIAAFKSTKEFEHPYTSKDNLVDLFFDENGRLLNYLPVNVDQNDFFRIHVVSIKGDETRYSVKITEGIYSPEDLQIRPYDKIKVTTGSSTDKAAPKPNEYSVAELKAGPFTSDYFKFQIAYDSSGTQKAGPTYSIKINKLYHVGIGVSIVSTNLENPEFKTVFNGTDTTIQAFNTGARTLFTFNAIWYWSVLQQNPKGSIITSGRDILKDEPTFSFRRIFPTVGISLDSKFSENFFVGAVYEFARGGSIIGGLHYGRVNVLADRNFELEKTQFSGTDADIKVDHEYKSGFFIGVNLDTRILNAVFGRGQ